jgi:TonB family protein
MKLEIRMKLAGLLLIAAASLQAQEILHETALKVTHSVPPGYTQEALDAKTQGVVTLSAVVAADGAVTEIKVTRGLGKGLDEKAVECLRKWSFSPATRHGRTGSREGYRRSRISAA